MTTTKQFAVCKVCDQIIYREPGKRRGDNHVEVWFDETSDSSDPHWCVSICRGDGEEIECLSTHSSQRFALESGLSAAAERGLALMVRETDGSAKEIYVAPSEWPPPHGRE